MLHKGILPHHTKWVKLFENLKYVVIDAELATALTGKAGRVDSGERAPRGDRYFAIYNPPVVNRQLWKSEVGAGLEPA